MYVVAAAAALLLLLLLLLSDAASTAWGGAGGPRRRRRRPRPPRAPSAPHLARRKTSLKSINSFHNSEHLAIQNKSSLHFSKCSRSNIVLPPISDFSKLLPTTERPGTKQNHPLQTSICSVLSVPLPTSSHTLLKQNEIEIKGGGLTLATHSNFRPPLFSLSLLHKVLPVLVCCRNPRLSNLRTMQVGI